MSTDLVEHLRYFVNNPSAWANDFDQTISDLVGTAATSLEALQSDVERLTAERDEARNEAASLSDDLAEALDEPWPAWASRILKLARDYSGYDGSSDAEDGVDLPQEVAEALAELSDFSDKQAAFLAAERRRVEGLKTALQFYADPNTYAAIGFLADGPCGEFTDDFDYDEEFGRDMPGKRARSALAVKQEG